ncbi:hypothetical protein M8C21_004648, partial [Ambrosia artemisiifolia]
SVGPTAELASKEQSSYINKDIQAFKKDPTTVRRGGDFDSADSGPPYKGACCDPNHFDQSPRPPEALTLPSRHL